MRSKTAKLPLVVLVSVVFVNSCVELTAIRKYAESSTVVAQNFPALSSDLYASCVRKYKYYFYKVVDFDPLVMKDVDTLSGFDKVEDYEGANPSDIKGNTPVKAEVSCRQWRSVNPMATALNKALVDYMKALGDLAADDLTSYDKDFESLTASLIKTGAFKDNEVTAGVGLTRFLTDAATNSYRRKKLKSAIERENGDVQILSKALGKYLAENYVLLLKGEQKALNDFYEAAILKHIKETKNSDPIAQISTKKVWDKDSSELQDRIDAAVAYGKIMAKVGEGHQKLYDARNDLNSKEVRQTALQYANDIGNLIEVFRKAF